MPAVPKTVDREALGTPRTHFTDFYNNLSGESIGFTMMCSFFSVRN